MLVIINYVELNILSILKINSKSSFFSLWQNNNGVQGQGNSLILDYRADYVSTSPGVNFINILHTIFLYERQFGSFFYVHVTREKLPKQRLFEKFVRKMLMKLIIGQLRGSEEKAHEFYDNNKTKLSIHNAPYQKAVMGRDVNNIVTVEFTFV